MRKSILLFLVVVIINLSGCCLFAESDEALLREMRKDLVESVRPALADALSKTTDNGRPFYVDAYRNEKVNLVDQMIESVDRLYPPQDDDGNLAAPYVREPLPWNKD